MQKNRKKNIKLIARAATDKFLINKMQKINIATLFLFGVFLLLMLCVTGTSIAQPNLQILGLFKDKALIFYKGKNKVVGIGDVIGDEGLKLISADSKSAVFDYKGQKYTYGISFHISNGVEQEGNNTFTIPADANNQYKYDIIINKDHTTAIFDMAQQEVMLSSEYADKIKLIYKDSQSFDIKLASGKGIGYKTILDEIEIAQLKATKVEAIVVFGSYPLQPIIGKKLMNNFNVREDKAKKLLIFH